MISEKLKAEKVRFLGRSGEYSQAGLTDSMLLQRLIVNVEVILAEESVQWQQSQLTQQGTVAPIEETESALPVGLGQPLASKTATAINKATS